MSSNNVISVTIVGDDTTAFFEHFSQVAERFGYVRAVKVQPVEAPAPDAPSSAPRRRGRQPRSASTEPLQPFPADEAADMFTEAELAEDVNTSETEKPVTMEEAKEAGRDVIGRKGTQTLREILDGFSVQKVIELKADQLSEFVEKCTAA